MTSMLLRLLVALVGLSSGAVLAQQGPDWPDWAYGLLEPLSEQSRVAPPCPDGSRPIDCAYIGAPVPDDGIARSLPGTSRTFTRNEANDNYGPADWYPEDHPPMPDIVAQGRARDGVRACALCHYPNGQGKMENGHVAGLSKGYILQQLEAFAQNRRRSADPRKANTNEMAMIAASLSAAEREEVAVYFSSLSFKPMIQVVEVSEVPQVRTTSNGLMLPLPGLPEVALGNRIIEVPEDPERTEMSRDPRGQWITYAPVGSVAAGEALVSSGGGKTTQCGVCHGQNLQGLADIPGIAGRTASYTMRQLWDFKQGSRQSPIMALIVANLTAEEMLQISAYLASVGP